MKLKESVIQKNIIEWLNFQPGVFAFRINVQGVPLHNKSGYRPSPLRGVSDIIACVNGHFVAIEVKTQKGKLSSYQLDFSDKIINSKGYFVTARSIEDVEKLLNHLNKFYYVERETSN